MTTESFADIAIRLEQILNQGKFSLEEKFGRNEPTRLSDLTLSKKGVKAQKGAQASWIFIHHSKGIFPIESVDEEWQGRGLVEFSFTEHSITIQWRDTHNGVRHELCLILEERKGK